MKYKHLAYLIKNKLTKIHVHKIRDGTQGKKIEEININKQYLSVNSEKIKKKI